MSLRYPRIKSNLILVSLLSYFFCGHQLYGEKLSNECVYIHIWSNKPVYFVHEPIVMNYQITNRSDHDITTIYISYDEYFEVHNQNGVKYPTILTRDYAYLSNALGPNKDYQGSMEISDQYRMYGPGKFTCYLRIPQNLFSPPCDTFVFSDTIIVEIIEPSGMEKEALTRFLHADSLHRARGVENRKASVATFLALAEKYPNSVYAPSALYWVALLGDVVDNDSVYIDACKKMIENYPESPFWSSIYFHLYKRYKRIDSISEARRYFAYLVRQYPNSKTSDAAEYWLERMQKEEF